MIVRSPAKRPMIFTLALLNREVIDASDSKPCEPMLIVVPILISIGTKPVAAIVMALVGEADGDSVLSERPEFLDQAVVMLARPFAS